jgi:hypothetical protein
VTNRLLLLALALLVMTAATGRGWAQQSDASVAQPQFTTASLTGVCGFTFAATNVFSGSGGFLQPRAGVGTLQFDGAGHVTCVGTENKHGMINPIGPLGPVKGTYSVGVDGRTGTIDLSGASNGFIAQFEIVDGGAELRFMNTGPLDPTLLIVKEVLIGACQF